jgi:hypothetical protein
MMEENKVFNEELVKTVFHPERLNLLCEKYNLEVDELISAF